MSDASGQGYPGQQGLSDNTSDFTRNQFHIWSVLARVRTITLVKVVAVDADAKTVDVVPLVKQMDGAGNVFPHGTVFGMPFVQIQGGASGVVLAPKVDDIGPALICDRDVSSVKATKAAAAPGSRRRFSFADGVYLGGILNADPTQKIEFNADDITIKTTTAKIEGAAHATGNISGDGDISAPTGTVSGENVSASAALSGASISIPGSSVANSGNPLLTGAGGVNLTGGFTETEFDNGTPGNGQTITPSPLTALKQKALNNVAGFTIAATGLVGDVELRITNGASAGTITFSGFSKQWPGDAIDATNGNQFIVFIYGYGTKIAYLIKALQ